MILDVATNFSSHTLLIKQLEANTFTEAPVGQATKKHAQAETDTAAYAKVGSLVAGAAVITYYGIPAASSVFFGGNG